ncbi:hypothetical protein [Rubrolithibacter danxiaensis]|uniref:hypothetical protein n=1 Tax=Rubrolithibacter danxiaensis TaxID=3390805 RepID=UPI003BF81958
MVTILKKGTRKEDIEKTLSNLKGRKKFDAYKYCGAIRLKESPLEIQKAMRNEWQ